LIELTKASLHLAGHDRHPARFYLEDACDPTYRCKYDR
jgi:hypothetical protein